MRDFKEVEVSAEAHYFRVWLAEMFLCDDHRLFRGFVPVVHSVVRLQVLRLNLSPLSAALWLLTREDSGC